jgi:hypothetical protein
LLSQYVTRAFWVAWLIFLLTWMACWYTEALPLAPMGW